MTEMNQKLERIVVEVRDGDGVTVKNAFNGVWLAKQHRTRMACLSVARTLTGFAVYTELDTTGHALLNFFDTFDEVKTDLLDTSDEDEVSELLAVVSKAVGEEYVVEHDW